MISFLDLPPEIRLPIYAHFLNEHTHIQRNRQPNNGHYRLLHVCRATYYEARPTFRTYVSLAYERQINAFIRCVDPEDLTHILWADVANDGRYLSNVDPRLLQNSKESSSEVINRPISNLHLALRRMTSLQRLRTFDCRHGAPAAPRIGSSLRMSFELCLFPDVRPDNLTTYELYLDPTTQASIFQTVPNSKLQKLRLSGDCRLPKKEPTPSLRSLNLHAITSNHFDVRPINDTFPDCHLDSFTYSMGHRMGFEIRDAQLRSLVQGIGSRLRKLVLLGCKRLTSSVISECLWELPGLECFALSLITHDELRSNFVLALATSVRVVKLHVVEGKWTQPFVEEENALCDALEDKMKQEPVLSVLRVHFRESVMVSGGRAARWKRIAAERRVDLRWGSWETDEEV